MFAKLVAVILGMGVVGGGLLAMRQQRLEAASELARVQVHIRSQDERLWKMRAEIARRTNPEHVREMAVALGPLRPNVPAPGTSAGQTRHAMAEPEVRDADPLPAGRARLAPPPGTPRPAHRARFAIVESDQ